MDGKKKRNKRKKGNQAKQSDSISTAEDINQTKPDNSVSNVVVRLDYDHHVDAEMNHHSEASSSAVSQSFGVPEADSEQEMHNFKENCKELQEENKVEVKKTIRSQKEGNLEKIIEHLHYELSSCVQREDSLEERIKQVEQMNQSIVLEESLIKDVVSNFGEAVQGLQLKMTELKESRDNLAEENRELTETISLLESRLQHLETNASLYDSLKIEEEKKLHQKAAAEVLVRPDIFNEEHEEKVFEIHVEPVQYSVNSEIQEATNDSSPPLKSATSTDYTSESQEKAAESYENIRTISMAVESVSVNGHEDFSSEDQSRQIQLLGLDDSRISEDVISVPLDDMVQESQPTAEMMVPISDAPLIGAPFRLISFVTRYVSGADLVDRPKSGR